MPFALGPHARARGYRLAALPEVGSTNAEALVRVRQGEVASGPLWIVTDKQTEGRGRRFRPWIASQGNLAASVVEVLQVAPAVAATLGFAAGLATEQALASIAPQLPSGHFRLKWPNDVLASGKKLCGILLEAEAVAANSPSSPKLGVVVGIGVNVLTAPQGMPYPTTSLLSEGMHVSAADVFAALSDSWATFRDIWDEGRGLGDIRRLWLDRAAGVGGPVSVKLGDKTLDGIFETIDDDGRLMVSVDGKLVPIAAGDVHFGGVASAGAR